MQVLAQNVGAHKSPGTSSLSKPADDFGLLEFDRVGQFVKVAVIPDTRGFQGLLRGKIAVEIIVRLKNHHPLGIFGHQVKLIDGVDLLGQVYRARPVRTFLSSRSSTLNRQMGPV